MSVKVVLVGLTQTVSPAFGRSGVEWSQGCFAHTPAGAHYLVPENTGDLETGSLGSALSLSV